MSGPSTHTDQTRYVGLIVQSSLKGRTVARGWGTQKIGCNLVDYLDFTSKKQKTGGKGGGGNATYTYSATLVLAICKGPIDRIRTIYKDQAVYSATSGGSKEVDGTTVTISPKSPEAAAGLTQVFLGSLGQAPWSYLAGSHPGHALGYSGLAYAAAYAYPLNSSATSPNHNFEVQFPNRATIGGVEQDDANPADIIPDLLSDVEQYPAGAVGDLTAYRTYCQAQGLFLSPLADQGRQGSDLLQEVLTCSNSDCLWEDGELKVVPYGDTAVTANGASFAPNLTPVYQLTWDDIIPNSAGEDPIQWDVKRPLEAYNYVQVGYLDRAQQYATDTVSAIDQASINTFGRRKQDPQTYSSVCLQSVANTIAQLMVQRTANVRRTAEFLLGEQFGLLSPMDLVNVPLPNGSSRFCRVVETNEQDDGSIQVQVEEMLVGAAHAALYSHQTAAGQAQDANAAPPDTAPPVLWVAPVTMTSGAYELWLAAAGSNGGTNWGGCDVWVSTDGDTYAQVGTIRQGTRFGETASDFPAASDPDTADTLNIDLSASQGLLTSATQAEADAMASLALVGSEVIAFSAVTQGGAYTASLGSYIRRGLYGTKIADQPSGSQFLRLDDSLFRYGFDKARVGQQIKVKLPAYNAFGRASQDLSLCQTYTVTLEPPGVTGPVPTGSYLGAFPNLAAAQAAGFVDGDTYYDEGLRQLIGSVGQNPQPVAGNGALSALDQADTAQIKVFATSNSISVEYDAAVTLPYTGGGASGGTEETIGSVTYKSIGGVIDIFIEGELTNQSTNYEQTVQFNLYLDGSSTPVENFQGDVRPNTGSLTGGSQSNPNDFFSSQPAAGQHTWTLKAIKVDGSKNDSTTAVARARIKVAESKDQV